MIKHVLSSGRRLLNYARTPRGSAPDIALVRLAEEVARVTDAHALERYRVVCQAIAQAEANIGYKLDQLLAVARTPAKEIESEVDRLDGFLAYHANRLAQKIEMASGAESDKIQALTQTLRAVDERLAYLASLAISVESARKAYPPIPINKGEAILTPSHDFDFVVPTVEVGLCAAMTRGVIDFMEPGVRAVIAENVQSGDFAVDAGANIGIHAVNMAARVGPTGRLVAFEPTPWIAEALGKTLTLNGFSTRSQVVQAAVADVPGTADFHISAHSPGNSLLRNELTADSDVCRVRVTTLDETIPAGQAIDFVKMDVEGVEPRVWRGMNRVLRESPDIRLVLEWSASHFKAAGNDPVDFAASIREMGFEMFEVVDSGAVDKPISTAQIATLECGNVFLKRR